MIHGYAFSFLDEQSLTSHNATLTKKHIEVSRLQDPNLLASYTITRPWVPLSGQEGRYFAKTPFEEADETFSWGMEIKDVLTLIWQPDTQSILYLKGRDYTPQRLEFWIYHTFFPLSLELNRSSHFLHVGAVEVEGKTLFFSAPSFGGKSTLTDYFIQKGATLLSDDALGIQKVEQNYLAIPAYPFHRPYREPEELGYPVKKFATGKKKINAIFLLEKAAPTAEVNIKEVHGIQKFKALHHAVFIAFPFRKEERFTFFGAMAQHIPVYTIQIPWDMKRLEEVYAKIIQTPA